MTRERGVVWRLWLGATLWVTSVGILLLAPFLMWKVFTDDLPVWMNLLAGFATYDAIRIAQGMRRRLTVVGAPGWTLLKVLSWVYPRPTLEGVFLNTIRDMQHEHIEALAAGKPWLARWVCLRGYCSVGAAALAQLPVSLTKLIVTLWKAAS